MRSSILSMISSYILHCFESMSNFIRISFSSPIYFLIVPLRSLNDSGEVLRYFSELLAFQKAGPGLGSFFNFCSYRLRLSFSSLRVTFYLKMILSSFSSCLSPFQGGRVDQLAQVLGNSCLVLQEGRKAEGAWLAPMLMVREMFLAELVWAMMFLGEFGRWRQQTGLYWG